MIHFYPVTAEDIRKYGVCKGRHSRKLGLGYWYLLCGCMKHPKGVSVIRKDKKWYWRRESFVPIIPNEDPKTTKEQK